MTTALRIPTEEEQLRQALAERETEIRLLLDTSHALNIDTGVEALLQIIAERAQQLMHARSVLIPILNHECTEYTYLAASGEYADEVIGETLPIDYGVCGWVWRHKKAWWQNNQPGADVQSLETIKLLQWENNGANLMMVPLIGKKHFLGGIACRNKTDGGLFNNRDFDLLSLFANQAAIAVENAMLYAERRELSSTLEKRVAARTTELQQLTNEMEAFSYSVSHDLRAPLRSVVGFSQALQEDFTTQLPLPAQDYLQRIHRSALGMQQLVDALLKLARLRRSPIDKEYIDLSHMADSVIAEIRGQQPEAHFEFTRKERISALGDINLLRIVLQNLFSNAVKFSRLEPQARIEFGTEQHEEQVYYVRDNGVGFDLGQAEHLFGAFQRLHTAAQFEGTGIGLATVSQIIHRHGGRIWADSRAGEGATFYFTLGY